MPLIRFLFLYLILFPFFAGAQSLNDLYSSAQRAYANKNFQQAEMMASKAIDLKQDNAGLWNFRGAIRSAQNNHEGAIKDFTKALTMAGDKDNYYYNRGVSYERLGQLTPAAADFDKALEINPENWTAMSSRGNIELEYGRFPMAASYFKQAIAINPQAFNPINNLAYAYNQLGNYSQAIELATKAIVIDSSQASAFNHRAFAYLMQGESSVALSEINKALDKDPKYAKSYYTRGLIYQKQNKLDMAKKDFQSSLDLTATFEAFFDQPYSALKKLEKKEKELAPPVILVTNPVLLKSTDATMDKNKNLEIKESDVRLSGRILSEAVISRLSVNDQAVVVDEDGFFEYQIPIVPGKNSVTIQAINYSGKIGLLQFDITRTGASSEQTSRYEEISQGKNYAICIGMANYDHPAINDLKKPLRDAELLANILSKYYSFDAKRVFILKDPSRADLFNLFDRLTLGMRPEDNLIIFYAGHGHWDRQLKRGYWLLKDANPRNRATWFSNSDLKDYIGAIQSTHTLLITDACFSGSIFETRGLFKEHEIAESEKFQILSRNAMTSGYLKPVPDESVFFKVLATTLRTNREKYIGTSTLFEAFEEIVRLNTRNTPLFGEIKGTGGEGGEFVFIRK